MVVYRRERDGASDSVLMLTMCALQNVCISISISISIRKKTSVRVSSRVAVTATFPHVDAVFRRFLVAERSQTLVPSSRRQALCRLALGALLRSYAHSFSR